MLYFFPANFCSLWQGLHCSFHQSPFETCFIFFFSSLLTLSAVSCIFSRSVIMKTGGEAAIVAPKAVGDGSHAAAASWRLCKLPTQYLSNRPCKHIFIIAALWKSSLLKKCRWANWRACRRSLHSEPVSLEWHVIVIYGTMFINIRMRFSKKKWSWCKHQPWKWSLWCEVFHSNLLESFWTNLF